MKGRPRSVEREVAAQLSVIGRSPVERIPVLGRTGPDITYCPPLNLIVDVKSRKACPVSMLANARCLFRAGDLIGVRLEDLLWAPIAMNGEPRPLSKTVAAWLDHMEEWTRAHEPDGISAIILHRPRMPIGHATVIIYQSDWKKLCQRLNQAN
jgi:hypothetical protein